MHRFYTLVVSVLLPLLAAGQPTDGVSWTASVESDGSGGSVIHITGRSDIALTQIHGTLEWQSCQSDRCFMPQDTTFSAVGEARAELSSQTVQSDGSVGKIWSLILEAVLWGLAMLLTPCVFPMVPMTVSFFLKGSENRRRGRFRAAMYGVFIVAIYTLPIAAMVSATRFFGGESVTADIFNTIATHWLPNVLFFVIFMVFAASFFGAFEFRLPSSWLNGADRKSDGRGLGGVFFMALTLVLVSFSCTGPIVGTVLIKSVQGSTLTPIVVMLSFSIAFALPFVIFALFPSLMQKIPRSGAWLGRVKIVLGFIELALGLKFLSVADQAYHWNILGREIYLGLWIVIFTLLGLYLAGVISFKGEEKIRGFSFGRLSLVILDFAFVLYLVQGLWGAPLTALSGYLPPNDRVERVAVKTPEHNDVQSTTLEDALQLAGISGKKVFLQVSGYGCVNCREMDSRVLSDPEVAEVLSRNYVTVVLYVDDKTPLPEDQWLTTSSGKVLKQVGKRNSYLMMQMFGINSQPSYVLLDSDGRQLKDVRGYNLSVKDFLKFLE